MWFARGRDEPEVTIWEKTCGHLYATLPTPKGVGDPLVLAAMAVDAIFAVGDVLFEPLSVDLSVACCDVEFGDPLVDPVPAARFHQLSLASPPVTVEIPEIWNDTRKTRCELLDRATVLDWLAGIIAEQECAEPGTRPGWAELEVTSVRARLPRTWPGRGKKGTLPVGQGNGVVDFPVERFADAYWVAGPLAGNAGTSPFDVAINNEGGHLDLHLRAWWSLWIEDIGTLEIDDVRDRLSAEGWRVTRFKVGGGI